MGELEKIIEIVAGGVVRFVESLRSLGAMIGSFLCGLGRKLDGKRIRARRRALKRSKRNSSTVKRYKHGRNYGSRVPAKRGTKCDSDR